MKKHDQKKQDRRARLQQVLESVYLLFVSLVAIDY